MSAEKALVDASVRPRWRYIPTSSAKVKITVRGASYICSTQIWESGGQIWLH